MSNLKTLEPIVQFQLFASTTKNLGENQEKERIFDAAAAAQVCGRLVRQAFGFVKIVSRNEEIDRSPCLSRAGSFGGAGKNAHDLIESGGVHVVPFRK